MKRVENGLQWYITHWLTWKLGLMSKNPNYPFNRTGSLAANISYWADIKCLSRSSKPWLLLPLCNFLHAFIESWKKTSLLLQTCERTVLEHSFSSPTIYINVVAERLWSNGPTVTIWETALALHIFHLKVEHTSLTTPALNGWTQHFQIMFITFFFSLTVQVQEEYYRLFKNVPCCFECLRWAIVIKVNTDNI